MSHKDGRRRPRQRTDHRKKLIVDSINQPEAQTANNQQSKGIIIIPKAKSLASDKEV